MINYFDIADIKLKVTGQLYDYPLYRLRDYKVENPEDIDAEIFYNHNDNIEFPECNIIKKDGFRVFGENDDYFISYDILKGEEVSALMEIKKDFKVINLYLKDVEDLGGASLSVRLFNMLGEVLKMLVIRNKGLCVHSSSISYKDNGIIFSAPSGTGKSTHTRLWMKNYSDVLLINDDMPVLKNSDGIWYLCGAPWSGKTEKNINKRVPLKAIVFLERGRKNEIFKIGAPECVMYLLKQTMMPPFADMAKKVMDNIKDLYSKVDFYRLKCNISDEAPEVVRDALGLK